MQMQMRFDRRKCWIGVCWEKYIRREYAADTGGKSDYYRDQIEYYMDICLVPCFPIQLILKGAKSHAVAY